MGYARLALYIAGLIAVVIAAWIFLTQTPIAETISPSISIAIIILLVGIGIMASARAMDDTFSYRKRVVRDGDGPRTSAVYDRPVENTGETVIEERRY